MRRATAELIVKDPGKFAHHDRVFLNNPVVMQGMGLAPLVVLATSGQNAVMLAAAVALLLLKKVVRHWTGVTACTLILSGGIGNIIDRIVHGYVVDMFDLQLFSYPVFNLADCCVVVGAILGGIYYLFLYDKYDKKKKESDHAHDPSDPS